MLTSRSISSSRKLAVGWFDNAPFKAICGKHLSRIKEVFFAWPGVLSCRPAPDYTPEALEILSAHDVRFTADMHMGSESAVAWGCDLTYDYVKINGDYRS